MPLIVGVFLSVVVVQLVGVGLVRLAYRLVSQIQTSSSSSSSSNGGAVS